MKAALITTLLLACIVWAPAQAQTPNQSDSGHRGKTSRSVLERSLDPDDTQGKAIGAALRRKAEQRERAWDLKMRQTMGAICTGC